MSDTCRSLLTRTYYQVKPFVPRRLRWAVRRLRAKSIRSHHTADWPILEAAGTPPPGWPGWPDGRNFALVLTHDVESKAGVDQVRALAEVEMRYGFRSSFNFIPEGGYHVPPDLRQWLDGNGFEIGVHDLNHDGKLYLSRGVFATKARRINHYLREWNATGFRSGFMLRELGWLHDLEIDYECSTFDTDPFEPQPTGVHTVFPYWIARNGNPAAESFRTGYVELPYTLPQDSTVFLLLREPDSGIWMRKTMWIAHKGGMVLLNVHPDYIDMNRSGSPMTYPLEHYEGFLRWLGGQYAGQAWHALPRDVSRFIRNQCPAVAGTSRTCCSDGHSAPSNGLKIWIDLENTPHIPFFLPIIRELRKQGHNVVLTARDCYQTCEMAGFHALEYRRIGRHYGRHLSAKVAGLAARTIQLVRYAIRERPGIALNLGSRSQNLAARLLGIPSVEIMDYEHTAESALLRPSWYLTPREVDATRIKGKPRDHIRTYDGIKEDVYVPDFKPDHSILDDLNLRGAEIVVTARPPATDAHYHNPESERLFARFMERVLRCPGAVTVLLPRNTGQEDDLRNAHPHWFNRPNVVIPERVINGLNLIWHSDLVVSGGGTMNREAAALGVPVYSVFRGPVGAIDLLLVRQRRLVLLESENDVDQKVLLQPRDRCQVPASPGSRALHDILSHLREIITTVRPLPELNMV